MINTHSDKIIKLKLFIALILSIPLITFGQETAYNTLDKVNFINSNYNRNRNNYSLILSNSQNKSFSHSIFWDNAVSSNGVYNVSGKSFCTNFSINSDFRIVFIGFRISYNRYTEIIGLNQMVRVYGSILFPRPNFSSKGFLFRLLKLNFGYCFSYDNYRLISDDKKAFTITLNLLGPPMLNYQCQKLKRSVIFLDPQITYKFGTKYKFIEIGFGISVNTEIYKADGWF